MGEIQNYIYELSYRLEKNATTYKFDKVLVSVIVPVFNGEKYIEKCLDSIVNQTLKELEIIIINDGSIDNTLAIISTYLQFDNRIKIINQINQKQGAARNCGLEIAQGDYVVFVDADDYIDLDYVEKMYVAAKENGVDFSVASINREKGKRKKFQTFYDKEQIYVSKNDIIDVIKAPPYFYVTGKLFNREFLKEVWFEERVFYEDVGFVIKIIDKVNSIVTVPNIVYHYVSNSTSTIKSFHSIAKNQDKINALVGAVEFARKNNLKMQEYPIIKKRFLGLSIDYYYDKKVYRFLGFKLITQKDKSLQNKTFLVFNTAAFGDMLLCNSLCQNIKLIYPKSEIVFIVDKPYYEIAKLQKDIDDVVVFDKKGEHKGIIGLIKFIKDFKYKNPFCSFVTYNVFRNYLISKLVGTQHTVMNGSLVANIKIQEQHANLLKILTHKEIKNLPIKSELSGKFSEKLNQYLSQDEPYVVICPLTKNKTKDFPLKTTNDLIGEFAKKGYKVILTGTGEKASSYVNQLNKNNFINLVDKTSIIDLGLLLLASKCLISADTGTMHYACSLGVPTVSVFYEHGTASCWSPDEKLYNVSVITENQSIENIVEKFSKLVEV